MKLLRYGAPEQEKPGTLDAHGQIRDLSKIVPDITGETISLLIIRDRPAAKSQRSDLLFLKHRLVQQHPSNRRRHQICHCSGQHRPYPQLRHFSLAIGSQRPDPTDLNPNAAQIRKPA